MSTIEIKNIGPLSLVTLSLNRYNVFIGKQSCGKSTISKIISHCLWTEKEVLTHPYNALSFYESTFIGNLIEFHNLRGYLKKDSYIRFESDTVSIIMESDQCTINKNNGKYNRNKILYIPAERNIVVYSDSIGGTNNLKSFSTDWQMARDYFDSKNKQSVLNLDINYYQEIENGRTTNKIDSRAKKNSYTIDLTQGSSGLQSVIPITVTIDFFTNGFYEPKITEKILKSNEKFDVKKLTDYFFDQKLKVQNPEISSTVFQDIIGNITGLTLTKQTCFVIEEPEINLFPETQVELLNYIIRCSNKRRRRHRVTITTHSPYTLSAINNLLLAGKLMENGKFENEVRSITGDAFIKPSEISTYAIDNGKVLSLIDPKTGLISENYLDSVSDVVASQFNELYKLYLSQIV